MNLEVRALLVIILVAVLLVLFVSCASISGSIAADVAFRPGKLSSSGARQEAMLAESKEIRNSIASNNLLIDSRVNSFLETNAPVRWTTLSCDGLSLVADFFNNGSSNHKYILIIHGYLSSKEQMRKFVPSFFDMGYSVVIPDSRAHGESQGVWTGMGVVEAGDIPTWVKEIIQYDSQASIAIMGVSCGASAAMIASSMEMPENVKCIVEDSGFTSVYDEMKYLLKTRAHIAGERIIKAVQKRVLNRAGFDIMKESPIESIAKTDLPVLFIHGSGDTFVPFSMLSELLDAYNGPYSDSLIIDGAPHAQSYNTDPEKYQAKLKEFLSMFFD